MSLKASPRRSISSPAGARDAVVELAAGDAAGAELEARPGGG
jgi:hypothetical protein